MQSGGQTAQKRDPALDLVRIFALITVISVHFFLHTGWYNQEVAGVKMLFLVTMRQFFMICVPLFMVLTGYLMSRKELSRGYYKKIGHTIAIYILASLACLLYRNLFTPKPFNLYESISRFFSFSAAPYGWYIEMYIGLFLLVPFLNLIWRNLKNKRQQLVLIGTLVLLSSLPSIFNVVNFHGFFTAEKILNTTKNLQLLPDYWGCLYPFMYYFIGCFIREHRPKLKTRTNLICLVITSAASGIFVFKALHHQAFISSSLDGHSNPFVVVLTTLVFLFFINLNYSRVPAKVNRTLAYLSSLCLGAYLVSWIFDDIFYPAILENLRVLNRFWMMPMTVLEITISSLFLSAILDRILKTLTSIYTLFRKRIRTRRSLSKTLLVMAAIRQLDQSN